MKMLYYCKGCDSVWNAEAGGSETCQCGRKLIPTGLTLEDWNDYDQQKKQELKAEWKGKQEETSVIIMEDQLKELRGIHFWIKFWSILSLIGMGILIIVLIANK